MKLLDYRVVRWGVALWMALQCVSGLFDGALVLSYKLDALGMTRFLGLRTEGDDYRRYVPLMDSTPAWGSILSLVAGALYFAVSVQVLRQRRSAVGLFAVALALSLGPWIYGLTNPLFVQAFSTTHLTRDALLFAVTALWGTLIWQGNSSQQRPAS